MNIVDEIQEAEEEEDDDDEEDEPSELDVRFEESNSTAKLWHVLLFFWQRD